MKNWWNKINLSIRIAYVNVNMKQLTHVEMKTTLVPIL